MDHLAVPKTYAAMSPVDRTVVARAQAVIEYERASLWNSAPQRVLVQLAGFLSSEKLSLHDPIIYIPFGHQRAPLLPVPL